MNEDSIFKIVSNYIDTNDYSSYTLQYPPLVCGEKYQVTYIDKIIENISSVKGNFGIYIHIPFCTTKCTFCRYFSFIGDSSQYSQCIDTVIREMSILMPYIQKSGKKISSLYIGGGTPNIVSDNDIDKVLKFFFDNFQRTEDFQFCIEFNPQESTEEKIKVISKYNCHRLTLGIQSLDPVVLSNVDRPQESLQVKRTIELARYYKIPYINIDLMAGIKGQTLESFLRDLYQFVHLKIDMIHIHPFCSTLRTKDKNTHDDEKLQMKMVSIGNYILAKSGYKTYSNDAPALSPYALNKQLSDASFGRNYLGFGVSSVSYMNNIRWVNTPNIAKYFNSILSGKILPYLLKDMTDKDHMRQYVIYTMRYKIIYKSDFFIKYNVSIDSVFSGELKNLLKNGRIKIDSDRIEFLFQNVNEYIIDTKYFYSSYIVKEILSNIINEGKKKYTM